MFLHLRGFGFSAASASIPRGTLTSPSNPYSIQATFIDDSNLPVGERVSAKVIRLNVSALPWKLWSAEDDL